MIPKLILADKEIIHVYNENGRNTDTIEVDGRFISNLFEFNGAIHALDIVNDKLVKIVDNLVEDEKSIELGMHSIKKIRRAGDFLYIQGEKKTGDMEHRNTLFVYDLGNESISEVIDNVISIFMLRYRKFLKNT